MRKIFTILSLIVLTISAVWAGPVDPARAKAMAQNFWSLQAPTRAAADFRNVSSEAGFDHLYIFNNENGGGFVILSADDAAIPVLGYSETDRFDASNMPDNFRWWLRGYDRTIASLIERNVAVSEEVAQQWNNLAEGRFPVELTRDAVSPLLLTRWDQDAPYNGSCPGTTYNRAVTGCVATAMAQVMKYHRCPATGTGSHSYDCNYSQYGYPNYGTLSANFGATTYDWDNMLNTYASANSGTAAQRDAVATLMFHCGVSVEMMYSPEGSGAYTYDVATALRTYFGYKNTLSYKMRANHSDSQWMNCLKSDLNAGRPVIYGGAGDEGGHCFVCDGYNSSNYFHFNWGWSGQQDGYYALSNISPGSGGIGGGGYDFTEDNEAIFGVEPINGGGGGGDDPVVTGCDYQHYPLPGTPTVYTVQTGGYLAGTNAYGDEAKADYFTYPTSGTISKMKIALGAMDGTDGSVDFTIWADNNGTPGNVLGSKTVTLAAVYSGMDPDTYEYECVFDSPIAITGNFFAGLNIANADSYFALQTTADGDGANTGWEMYQGNWSSYEDSWQASLTNAIFPYVCADEDDPETSDYNLQLYNDFAITPNPMVQNQNASITATIANYGTTAFSGAIKLALLTTSGSEAQVIQQGTLNGSISPNAGSNLSLSGNITVAPGTYKLALYYMGSDETAWSLVGDDLGHDNPLTVTVTGNTPATQPNLQMFGNFTINPNPLVKGQSATVGVSVINQGTGAFNGAVKLVLEDANATQKQLIQQKNVSGINANSTDILSFTGNITVPAGGYKLALYYKPTGSSNWTYVGTTFNSSFQNPKTVTVVNPTAIADLDAESVSIYPNPASDFVCVNANVPVINNVQIYNMLGSIVWSKANVPSGEQLNISTLTPGVYMIRLTTSEGIVSRKIVKK